MHRFAPRIIVAFFLFALAAGPLLAANEARLLRFADIHHERIAFVYAGDIWTVSVEGGAARRLTTHEGLELFPKFSPDGRSIAFSAEYSGSRQVWVMDAEGGAPRQLTYYNDVGPMPPRGGFDNQVLDWSRDGKQVLFRANRLPWGVRMGRPYLVPAEGGTERPLAVPESGGGMFSPDGSKLVYTPISREFRTWKGYRGGRAQDVWIFDLKSGDAEQITESEATDNQPVWVGETIYFTSDREGRLNLWAMEAGGGQARKVTDHEDYDVLWPSAGPRAVVYECGGFLYRFDPVSGRSEKVRVEIGDDFRYTLPRFREVSSQIATAEISPTGKRALFAARGDIFTVPAEKGEARNLTRTPGIREMDPSWSPDGRWVAYLSDRSGEYEIYLRAHDGSGEERRVTTDGDVWRFAPVWSPDSEKLAYGDKKQRLRYVEVESGKTVDVDSGTFNDIQTYRWSPGGEWLVYTKLGPAQFSSVYAYSVGERKVHRLTDDFTNDYEPVFDPKGRYLYFLSDRDFNLTFSDYEFNYFYTDPTRVYAALLQVDGPALLLPDSDEEQPQEDRPEDRDSVTEKGEKNAKKKGDESDEPLRIDVEGIAERVVALPGDSADYRNLAATEEGVLFLVGSGGETELKIFSLEDEKTKTVLEGVSGFDLSRDGKKLLYQALGEYGIVDVGPDQSKDKGKLDLGGMQVRIDPPVEWRQIWNDGWRIVRDWFYDPGLHGLDWEAMLGLYTPMFEAAVHRADLDYVFGEIGGELNAGHFYVNWGDVPQVERRDGGLLGAEILPDDSGYFRIHKIFQGENWHPTFRSPLTEPGVDVSEGDLILAVDGRSARDVKNFYELLENTAGKSVTLQVNDRPKADGARDVRVRPVRSEGNLRYLDWIRERREMVDRLSGGRIGYIHLPNTAGAGNRELRKYFYPQAHKEALIFDARYNGGGFIPDRMLELVSRTSLSYWARRGIEPMRTPGYAHDGPKVCLINAYSSSGGDAFPYYFRKLGLGPVIGMRTWGGLIGISFNPGLMDGGSLNVPSFRFIDTEGNWAVENVGVEPDIEVLDRPDLVARGEDPTLTKAVEVLLEQLNREPATPVEVPEPPRYDR